MTNITINEIKTLIIRKFADYEVQSDASRSSKELFLQKEALSTGLWKTWTVSLNNVFALNQNLGWKFPQKLLQNLE